MKSVQLILKSIGIIASLFLVVLLIHILPKEDLSNPQTKELDSPSGKPNLTQSIHKHGIDAFHPNQDAEPVPDLDLAEIEKQVAQLPDGPLKNTVSQFSPSLQSKVLHEIRELDIPRQDLANSVHASPSGYLYYVCAISEPGDSHAHALSLPVHEPDEKKDPYHQVGSIIGGISLEVPVSHPPIYHSKPGASRKIFLDFNGHVVKGTEWNEVYDVEEFHCGPAFLNNNRDSDTFDRFEVTGIEQIWKVVAQHFSKFDVDVTTEEPDIMDDQVVHVLITPDNDINGVANPRSDTASGVAFINVFGTSSYAVKSPVFVYTETVSAARQGIVAVHEVGHYLGLSHDGNSQEEYYPGHTISSVMGWWSTIMGSAYGSGITQWSKGDYYDANNHEDDLQIIASKLPPIHSSTHDSFGSASPATLYGNDIFQAGTLVDGDDVDWFSVELENDGDLFLEAEPQFVNSSSSTPVDLYLELYDSTGTLAGTASQIFRGSARLSLYNYSAGKYYIKVGSSVWGDPFNSTPTGYSKYGNHGNYVLSGTKRDDSSVPKQVQFVQHPQSVTAVCGTDVTLDFDTTEYGRSRHRWQYSTDNGQTWINASEYFQDSYDTKFTMEGVLPDMDGCLIRCEVSVENEILSSDSARLTVVTLDEPFPVTHQPEDLFVVLPEETSASTSFGIEFLGDRRLQVVMWQSFPSYDGEWYRLHDQENPILNLQNIKQVANGQIFRCRVLNHSGLFYSDEITLTVHSKPEFVPVFLQYELPAGSDVIFRNDFVAGFPEDFSYAWGYQLQGESDWHGIDDGDGVTGATTPTLQLTNLDSRFDNSLWRLAISNPAGGTTSQTISISMDPDTAIPALAKSAISWETGLYLRTDGSLWGAGDNSDNQLGPRTSYYEIYPILIQNGDIVDCANSSTHSLFLKDDGTLWGLGSNESYRLGLEEYGVEVSTPVRIAPEFDDIIACEANYNQSLFLREDRSLWAIGRYIEEDDGTAILNPVKVSESVAFLCDEFYITSSGKLFQFSEPYRFNNRYIGTDATDFVEAGAYRYIIDRDGKVWELLTYSSPPTLIAENALEISESRWSESVWIHKSDGTLWTFNGNNKEMKKWADDVQRFFDGGKAALYMDEDKWVWGIASDDNGLLGTGSIPSGQEQTVPVEVKYDFHSPSAPRHAQVDADDSFYLISWGRSKGASSFNVWRNSADNFSEAQLIAEKIKHTFWFDTEVSPASHPDTYYYWVEAVNQSGISSPTGSLSAQGIENPSELIIQMSAETIQLAWQPAFGADSYTVWNSQTDSLGDAIVVATGIQDVSWTDESTNVHVPQYYWVQAINAKESSDAIGGIAHEYVDVPIVDKVWMSSPRFRIEWRKPHLATDIYVYQSYTNDPADATVVATSRWGSSASVEFSTLSPIPNFWIQAHYQNGASILVPASMSVLLGENGIKDYATFKNRYFPVLSHGNLEIVGPNADPDGDGRINLIEYVFYGDPLNPDDSESIPEFPTGWYMPQKPRPIAFRPGLPNLQYSVQISTNLADWGDVDYNHGIFMINADYYNNGYLTQSNDAFPMPYYIRITVKPVGPIE